MYTPTTKRRALDSEELQPFTFEEPATRITAPSEMVTPVRQGNYFSTSEQDRLARVPQQFDPFSTPIEGE